MNNSIKIWDSKTKSYFVEKVLGGHLIEQVYGTSAGRKLISNYGIQQIISKLVEAFQKSSFSKKSIVHFIHNFEIKAELFESPTEGYESFNDFFIRRIKNPLSYFENPDDFKSPVEARLSVFEFSTKTCSTPLVVKGQKVSLRELIDPQALMASKKSESKYTEGIPAKPDFGPEWGTQGHAWVFRLCPVDYHRFHFFDDGFAKRPFQIPGLLHSVNPLSLKTIPQVFLKNERQLTRFESLNWGPFYYIEVGALCVGKIIQTYAPETRVLAGQEKGFFEFGGSTLILLSSQNFVTPNSELLGQTNLGFETKVFLGDKIGFRARI
jgi:phosphatidylserine decarboxylase